MLRCTVYIGRIESPEYGISTRGDFEPLVRDQTFYRAQAVSQGRAQVSVPPRERNHPDFPLRGFVRCETCARPLTGSWSKGRNNHYAYYHCQRQCRAVNVSKAKLEGLNRTAVSAPFFNYLAPSEGAEERMVSRLGIEPRTRRLRVCCSAN